MSNPSRRPAAGCAWLRLALLLALAVGVAPRLAGAADAPLNTPANAPAAAPIPPGTPLFQVEMVVFRVPAVRSDEDWNIAPPGRFFGTNPGRPAPPPQVVRVLSGPDYALDGIVRRLRSSGTWSPVAHAAWVQTAPPWGTHMGLPLSAVGIDVPGLTGTIYLERARDMHLGFDVSLQSGTATYTIDEMADVRQNQKQYFDHPAFGIIAVVRALKTGK